MKILRERKLEFKKGEVYHLDEVYDIYGLFPEIDVYWEQDEGFNDSFSGGDSGESVRILKNFTIEYKVKG